MDMLDIVYFPPQPDATASDAPKSAPSFDTAPYIAPTLVSIAVVSLVANVTVAFIARNASARNAPTFIFSLALADLVIALLFVQCTHYPFGATICEPAETFYQASLGVSALTLIAFGAFAFLDEFARDDDEEDAVEQGRAVRNAVVAVALIWTLAVGSAVLTMLSWGHNTIKSECLSSEIDTVQHAVFTLALYYAIPLTIVAFILVGTRRNGTANVLRCTQKNVAYSLYLVITVYAICFYPLYLGALGAVVPYADNGRVWNYVSGAGCCLGLAYRCFYPVALYCASGGFRKLAKRRQLSDAPKTGEASVFQSVDAAFSLGHSS